MRQVLWSYFSFLLCLAFISFCISELLELNRTSIFHSPFGFLDLHTMLLDEYQERLFVGGKDLVYSLSLEQINNGYREVWKYQTVFQKGKKSGEGDIFLHGCYLDYFLLPEWCFYWKNKVFIKMKSSWEKFTNWEYITLNF